MPSTITAARATPGPGPAGPAPVPSASLPAPEARREALLELFEETQRRMMARLDASSAGEWLRLDISTSQLKLLLWLCATGAQPMGQIARTLGVTMPSATALVDRLVEAGLAEREHDTADRRVVFARASAAGVALVARFREVGRERMRHILRYVPEDAFPALISGMRALTHAVARADADAEVGTAAGTEAGYDLSTLAPHAGAATAAGASTASTAGPAHRHRPVPLAQARRRVNTPLAGR